MQSPVSPDGGEDVVAVELELRRQELLLSRLRLLHQRQVPLRTLRAAPAAGSVRLGFADSTVLLVQLVPRADLLATALFVRRGSVRIARCWRAEDHPLVELVWAGGSIVLPVLGTDQPD